MTKPLLIVKNCTHEGPGLFEEVLKKEKLPYEIIELDNGDCWPELKEYGALMIMGGPDSANDRTEKMLEEIMQLQKAIKIGIPCLGICLGLQTLVKAAGGSVRKNSIKEIGCKDRDRNPFTVTLTQAGANDPLFAACKPELSIFHLHGETVDLTPGMTVLATGKWCVNQVVHIAPRVYGIQGHWDVTKESLKVWIENDADLKAIAPDRLMADWNEMQILYFDAGRKVFRNFLTIAGLIS
jgi:GMP synthase (glutamine-hydrolysing)